MDAISLALQVTVRISSSLFGHGVAILAKPGSGFDASIEGPRVGLFKFFLAWYQNTTTNPRHKILGEQCHSQMEID